MRERIAAPALELEPSKLGGVPGVLVRPESAGALPTMVFYHGWGTQVEWFTFLATVMAQQGYNVWMPEVPLHGQRGHLENHFNAEGYARYWEAVMSAVDEVPNMISDLAALPFVDGARLALVGSSMGGQIASAAFARNLNVKVLAAVNSAPNFVKFEDHSRKQEGRPPVDGRERERLRAYDPMEQVAALAGRKILLLHGTADEIMPFALTAEFHEKLGTSDLRPARHVGHHLTLSMLEECLGYLRDTL
ncbi:alpha/beta fold hydrolase [Tumebacillus flagellatus]|uniref:Peptidase S9 prolyl oligopeptidase catalytic domain-containing protein n=1 Tax=Tumebacillus flagellatus TaxID=1157490 RepID=A0A074LXL5_9BACL|nr:alpha/beta fold hydrolase [Tumebacillus flagellatus]KEO85170.1 hypothetical protein EL26_01020 [Tumebacillus flagellatus]